MSVGQQKIIGADFIENRKLGIDNALNRDGSSPGVFDYNEQGLFPMHDFIDKMPWNGNWAWDGEIAPEFLAGGKTQAQQSRANNLKT